MIGFIEREVVELVDVVTEGPSRWMRRALRSCFGVVSTGMEKDAVWRALNDYGSKLLPAIGRESAYFIVIRSFLRHWIPVFAGMTFNQFHARKTFYPVQNQFHDHSEPPGFAGDGHAAFRRGRLRQ
jgi:hypothetical protein